MPQDEGVGEGTASQGRRLRVYTCLCQLTIATITFYCAVAITRYNPERDFTSRAVATRPPLSDANSTTSHICNTGTREDIADPGAVLVAITPYSVLCPNTSLFLLSLVSFFFGIFKFNSLHTEDLDLADGYAYFIIAGLISLDRQNFIVSLQATMPMVIWSATVLLPVTHWLFRKVSPEMYVRYRRMCKSQAKEFWRLLGRSEREGNIEAGGEAVGGEIEERNEETPLRRDERRTGLHAQCLV